jgi:7-cyano-7-deazaguanine synthase in queuosine biosynthesis
VTATPADNIPDVLTDMLEIAAYVYCADQFTKRGTELMTNMGADWRRKFRFRIPVRCPDVWGKDSVREALVETLGFLSEDEFSFDFRQATTSTGLQPYLGFSDPSAQAISPDEVILFSGGLDSLAGTVDELIGNNKKVALVSHQSSTTVASKQNGLVNTLRERLQGRQLFYVPVTINKGQEEAVTFTQRSRSLLFATLGLIIARMFRNNKLSFFENGIVSFNFPISEHVLGARASRTTHPRVLADCSRLFSQLLSDNISIQNPYLWKTKSEVVQVLADRGCADLISQTLSCTRVREATKIRHHCGTCSQCVDRQFGILAADLAEYEPVDNYAIDLFKGQHEPGPALTMVESYVVRAQKLATMSEQTFLASYGQVFRALPYLPGSPEDNVRQIYELHRRHGQQVIQIVDRELKNNASLVQTLSLPVTSLLAMIVSPVAKQPDYIDPIEAEQPASAQAATDTHTIVAQPVVFAIDHGTRKVIFRGGPELKGAGYGLVCALAKEFEEDIESGIMKDAFRYIKADELAKRLGIDEQNLRQRVSRTRKAIEQQFLNNCDIQLDPEDVVQNEEWKGYRLNPYLLLVKPTLLQGAGSMSQLNSRTVTTPPQPR